MTIRPLTSKDIPALRELAIEIFSDTFAPTNTPENMDAFITKDYSFESFEKEFSEPDNTYFFICDGDRPAGYLRLRYNSEVDHILGKNHIELQRLYVHQDFHGKKVADELMKLALEIGKQKNHEWIWLGVWELNPRAQRFYTKWGFEKFSEHAFVMGDDAQTDWLMKKSLL